MSSIWGNKIKISVFGESHGQAIGVTIDGLPSGIDIDESKITDFMQRRASRGMLWSTSRQETDTPRILSGLYKGKTTGTPLCAIIENQDTRSQDYSVQDSIPRPGHADLTAMARYLGFQDPRGGGHFSGRLTAPIAFAGAICKQILEKKKVFIFSHISSIGDCKDKQFDSVNVDMSSLGTIASKDFPVLDDSAKNAMVERILTAKNQMDSVGGIVECMACGVPAGLGNPIFDSVESRISSIVFGIPAVKGVEFGAGFEVAGRQGSQNNDVPYFTRLKQTLNTQAINPSNAGDLPSKTPPSVIRYKTNNAGGVEGGITNGMPVMFRVAFKPTPSIAMEQESIDLLTKENVHFQGKGRHDPCIVPRAVPVVESVCAIAILDLWMESYTEG